MQKLKSVEKELSKKEESASKVVLAKGRLNVNGPLPLDFSDQFAAGVAEATGCKPEEVELLGATPLPALGKVEQVMFRARSDCVASVEKQASDVESKLANGGLHSFLVARDDEDEEEKEEEPEEAEAAPAAEQAMPCPPSQGTGPEVDMSMPYGDLEPFGREDTAQELTESSIRESNAMVDQLERAEVAEEKRAVFRALTRLRGAAITSYDGIARSQTGNIDDYARTYQWRKVHPVHHLASEEADVAKWAFPDDADCKPTCE